MTFRCTSDVVSTIRRLARRNTPTRRIAMQVGCSHPAVIKIAKRFEIVLLTRSEAARVRNADAVHRATQSAATAATWADPEKRAKRLASMRTPEAIENRRDGRREAMRDPLVRRATLASLARGRQTRLDRRRA